MPKIAFSHFMEITDCQSKDTLFSKESKYQESGIE
jgi:hypothetical protein